MIALQELFERLGVAIIAPGYHARWHLQTGESDAASAELIFSDDGREIAGAVREVREGESRTIHEFVARRKGEAEFEIGADPIDEGEALDLFRLGITGLNKISVERDDCDA